MHTPLKPLEFHRDNRPYVTPPIGSPRALLASIEHARLLFSRDTEVDICKAVCRYTTETLEVDLAWVGLESAKHRKLKPVFACPDVDPTSDLLRGPWYESPFSQDPVLRAHRSSEPAVINDLDPNRPATWQGLVQARGFHSLGAFPICREEEIVGVLALFSQWRGWFHTERVRFLQTVADVAGLALERCRLVRDADRTGTELERRVQDRLAALETQYLRLAALAEVSLLSDNPSSILDDIVSTTARLLPASAGASIVLWDEEARDLRTSVSTIPGQGRDSTASRIRRHGGATRWIIDNREPLAVPDVNKTPFPPNDLAVESGIKAFVGLPVIAHGRVLGVLYAMDRHHRVYSKEDMEFLTTMANRVAAALVSARLLESERRQRQLAETLREVTCDLNSTLELPVILHRLLDHVAKLIPFDSGFVLIEREGRYHVEAVRGAVHCERLSGRQADECCGRLFAGALSQALPQILEEDSLSRGEDCCFLLRESKSVITLPLRSADRVVGVLALSSVHRGFFGKREADIAYSFAQQAAIAVRNANLFSEVKRMATLDPLTRIYNRGHFFEMATLAFKSALRYRRPFTVFMMDIDRFKGVNDSLGHQAGDEVLRIVVDRFRSEIRDIDILGRYGGDEFALALPETSLEDAAGVAERLLARVASRPAETSAGPVAVSISIGVASICSMTENFTLLMKRADEALYHAKSSGRNRISVSQRLDTAPRLRTASPKT